MQLRRRVLVGREGGEVVLLGREGKREFSEEREAEHVPEGRECGKELAPRMELAGGEEQAVSREGVGSQEGAGSRERARKHSELIFHLNNFHF